MNINQYASSDMYITYTVFAEHWYLMITAVDTSSPDLLQMFNDLQQSYTVFIPLDESEN